MEFIEKYAEFIKDVVKLERTQWDDLYNIIEDFIKRNDVLVAGEKAINIITSENTYPVYEIYAKYPLTICNTLTNYLHEKIQNITIDVGYPLIVSMRTVIPKHTFSISITGRTFVLVRISYEMEKITSWKINGLKLMPPEIFMIDIYRSMGYPDDDVSLFALEEKMFGEIKKRESIIVGGLTPIKVPGLLHVHDDVFVNYNYDLSTHKYTIHNILSDFRIHRYKVKLDSIIYVYDVSFYDILGLDGDELHPIARLRFLLIEMWILTTMKKDFPFLKKKIKDFFNTYIYVRSNSILTKPTKYFGSYIPEKFFKRQKIKEGKFYSEYFPSKKMRIL